MNLTPAEYAALLARRQAKVEPGCPGAMPTQARNERTLHEAILAECRRRQWIALHGSMGHRTHRTIGEPDFVILGPSGAVWLIECKRVGGKLSPEQVALNHWARMLGHTIHVIRSMAEFQALIPAESDEHHAVD